MCLKAKKDTVKKIAEEDIVVWKYLCRFNFKYYTPYQNMKVKVGKQYRTKLGKMICYSTFDFAVVNEGFHSFKFEEDAHTICKSENQVVCKCVIPKGSEYYEGTYEYPTIAPTPTDDPYAPTTYDFEPYPALVSSEIRYEEIIEKNKKTK